MNDDEKEILKKEKEVEKLKPKGKAYRLTLGNGLLMRVSKSGEKVWYYYYKILGKQRSFTIGKYPDVSYRDARRIQQQARQSVIEYRDPKPLKDLNKTDLVQVSLIYLEQLSIARRHVAEGVVRNSLLPAFAGRQIAEIGPDEIDAALYQIEHDEGRGRARLCRGVLRLIFDCARAAGIVRRNPVP